MIRPVTLIAALALFATPAAASLPVGAKAPNFTTRGAIGGKVFRLNLAEQLRKGPVVLYFFPKVFTKGCTVEANAFAEATADFRRAGADPDPRMAEAVEAVRSKQQADGRWLLERVHPGRVHIELDEGVGAPSRWNTLRALRVLAWWDGATSATA